MSFVYTELSLFRKPYDPGKPWYSPGHPWHYYWLGDADLPMAIEAIPPAMFDADPFYLRWPKPIRKRKVRVAEALEREEAALVEDEARYRQLLAEGEAALSWYDREICYDGNARLALACAVAAKFNHVSYRRGRIRWLEENGERLCG